MYYQKIIKFDVEGSSEIEGILWNPRRIDWGSSLSHLNNNKAHLEVEVIYIGMNYICSQLCKTSPKSL